MRAFKRPKHFAITFAAAAMILACDADTAEQDTTNSLVNIISLETAAGNDELFKTQGRDQRKAEFIFEIK